MAVSARSASPPPKVGRPAPRAGSVVHQGVLLLEEHARLVLVLHAVLGASLVAATTHLVVWMRGYLRGAFPRQRAVRRFSSIAVALFGLTFAVGNLAYPTYKVRVRAGYLENPAAVAADLAARGEPADRVEPALATTSRVARWFDVKEHWAVVGLMLAAACWLILRVWDPTRHGAAVAPLVFGLAVGASAIAWLAAIVGLVAASYRSIGSL
jgi:hypothetical protein